MLSTYDLTHVYKSHAVQEKMEFIENLNRTVSHEMMTPLNCIIAFSKKIGETA